MSGDPVGSYGPLCFGQTEAPRAYQPLQVALRPEVLDVVRAAQLETDEVVHLVFAGGVMRDAVFPVDLRLDLP
jgi:hypothetical protein